MRSVLMFILLLFFLKPIWAQSQLRYEGYIESGGSPVNAVNQTMSVTLLKPGCANTLGLATWTSTTVNIVNGEFNLVPQFANTNLFAIAMDPDVNWGAGACAPGAAREMQINWNGFLFNVSLQDAPRAAFADQSRSTKSLSGVPAIANMTCTPNQYLTINAAGEIRCSNLIPLAAGDIPTSTAIAGDVTGNLASSSVVALRGHPLSASVPTAGQVLEFDGTQWVASTDDTGAVPGDASYTAKGVIQFSTNAATSGISVTAGIAQLADTIVAAGPIGSSSVVPVITYDAKGRLTAVSTSTVNDPAKLPLAGGAMTGPINMGLQNITNVTSVASTNFSGRNILLSDNDVNVVTLRAPTNLPSDYTLTLPVSPPTNGFVLSTDAVGQLSWIAAASGSISSLTSTNSYLTVDSTVPSSPTLSVNVGTVANTLAAGNDARITGALQSSDYIVDVNDAATCAAGQVPYWNTIGNRWMCQSIGSVANATNAINLTGSLTGDVLGTQTSTTVARIRGVNVATLAPSIGQILKFDGTDYVPSADVSGISTETDPTVQMWAKQAPNPVFTTLANELSLSTRVAAANSIPSMVENGQSLRWNKLSNTWEYFTPAAAGSGIDLLNGVTLSTQTFAIGNSGVLPNFNSNAGTGVHTLNIPSASSVGVTSGTISKSDYDTFQAKLTSPLTSQGDLLVRNLTTETRMPAGTNGQILSVNFAVSEGLQWINPPAADINSVNAGAGLINGGVNGDVTLDVGAGNGILVATDSISVDIGLGANKIPQVGGTALGANSLVITNGTGTVLTSLNCSVGQVIKFDASGFANCGSDNDSAAMSYIQNGNSFGGQAVIGTNDNFGLSFETNGQTRMSLATNGNVGIGTISPMAKFQVYDSTSVPIQPAEILIGNFMSGSSVFDGLVLGVDDLGNAKLMNQENTTLRIGTDNSESIIISPNQGTEILNAQVVPGIFTYNSSTASTVISTNGEEYIQVLVNGTVAVSSIDGCGTSPTSKYKLGQKVTLTLNSYTTGSFTITDTNTTLGANSSIALAGLNDTSFIWNSSTQLGSSAVFMCAQVGTNPKWIQISRQTFSN